MAPKWCPFIENITEELEEDTTNTVYDEYKFLSLEDLEKI
jgi:ribosome biogenesis protein ENP2